ncbi:BQ2448_161 [Microbotryum intermedium]|uniref:BQ2448_161 protein n=1 Tax=Microbotryum intermedium TaxID=269621 RepID=A0A238F1P4_9BASI|nr:BQ2448_161 [Microbotryum intermedium]
MKLTPAKISKKAAAATAHIDAITNDMLDTSASELLRRQPAAAGVETISFLERWSTSGTQEIVLHQKEVNGERSIWRFVGASKDLPNMMKHVRAGGVIAAGKRARRAEDDNGAADDQDDDEIEIEAPGIPRRPAAAAAAVARPTAGTARARKAAAAAAAALVVYGPGYQDPFVTPSTSVQRTNTAASSRLDSSAPRAPKKARRVPDASSARAENSEDEGDATETETTPRGSKRSTASSNANSSPSVYNNNVTLRRSLRRRREVSELSESTSTLAASLDDLGSLCGGLDDLGFDVTDQDIDMSRGSIVPRPMASTSRVKIEHEL